MVKTLLNYVKGNLHSSTQQLSKLQHSRINYKFKYTTKVNKNVTHVKTHQTTLNINIHSLLLSDPMQSMLGTRNPKTKN